MNLFFFFFFFFFWFPKVEFLINTGKCAKMSRSHMTLIPFHMINISLHVKI